MEKHHHQAGGPPSVLVVQTIKIDAERAGHPRSPIQLDQLAAELAGAAAQEVGRQWGRRNSDIAKQLRWRISELRKLVRGI